MVNEIEDRWFRALTERAAMRTIRRQQGPSDLVDFYSNDYLGMATNDSFQQELAHFAMRYPDMLTGPRASRVLRGHHQRVAEVEEFIASQHGVQRALLVGSGYKANLALCSCLLARGDTVIVDEFVHRSIHDACSLGKATKWKFKHQDLDDLESKLKRALGHVVVIVESLYSMDGDLALLPEILSLCRRFGAQLLVDEAHAIGVFGLGRVRQLGLQQDVMATVVTYGKALGFYGAAILGSNTLCDYLINFSSPLIYSTAVPVFQAQGIQQAYLQLEQQPRLLQRLQEKLVYFAAQGVDTPSAAESPIKNIRFANCNALLDATEAIRQEGIDVYPIFPPTVKAGSERLRICIHNYNTSTEIDLLCKQIKRWQ